jgi:hypothetical protein
MADLPIFYITGDNMKKWVPFWFLQTLDLFIPSCISPSSLLSQVFPFIKKLPTSEQNP